MFEKYDNEFLLCFIILLFAIFNSGLVELKPTKLTELGCHEKSENISWRLIWQDTFGSLEYSKEQWNLTMNNISCSTGKCFSNLLLLLLLSYVATTKGTWWIWSSPITDQVIP